MWILHLLLIPCFILALMVSDCGATQDKTGMKSEGTITLKLASVTPMDHTYNQGAARFASLVRERSKGRIKIDIYPDGRLGKGEKELLEAVQRGTIDCYAGSTGTIGGFSPSMAILDLPFLFRDYGHVDKVLDGPIGRQLLDDMEKANFKSLAFWENGFRNLTNDKKAVKGPADAKGLKIRTMENKIHMAAWKAVGANPVPMGWGEVYKALQQKTIDGQENPIALIYSSKIYEVQKYLSLTRHVYSPAVIVVNLKVWQGLSREDQAMMQESAREVGRYERKLGRDTEEKHLAELAARGMTIAREIDKQAWYKAMEKGMGEFIASFGKDKVEAIINTR
jgi:tripartite ATP-independent transporter DctP family solute receptor